MVDLPITKWIKKKIRRLIGIVEDTDVATHSIASGKYVVWKGDLYKATDAIAVGGSLSLSNLSPVSDGGFNELSEQIGTVATWADITSQCTWNQNINNKVCKYNSVLKMVALYAVFPAGSAVNGTTHITLPTGMKFAFDINAVTMGEHSNGQKAQYKIIEGESGVKLYSSDNAAFATSWALYGLFPVSV